MLPFEKVLVRQSDRTHDDCHYWPDDSNVCQRSVKGAILRGAREGVPVKCLHGADGSLDDGAEKNADDCQFKGCPVRSRDILRVDYILKVIHFLALVFGQLVGEG